MWRGGQMVRPVVLAAGLAVAVSACSARDAGPTVPPSSGATSSATSSAEVTSSELGGTAAPTGTADPGASAGTAPTAAATGVATPADGLLLITDLPGSWTTGGEPATPATVVPKRCAVLSHPWTSKRTSSAVATFTGARASFLTDEVSVYPAPAASVVAGFRTAMQNCSTFTSGTTTFLATPLALADLGDASAAVRISSRTGSVTATYDVALVSIGRTTVAVTGGGLEALPTAFWSKTVRTAVTRAGGAA